MIDNTGPLDDVAARVMHVINNNLRRKFPNVETPLLGFAWKLFSGKVSNTHSAPRNGVINWWDDSGKPSWYYGWSGRVWVRYASEVKSFGSDGLEGSMTYVGTGGYGSYNGPWTNTTLSPTLPTHLYSWDYRIYEDDWPLLADQMAQDRTFRAIEGTGVHTHQHNFEWQHQSVLPVDHIPCSF